MPSEPAGQIQVEYTPEFKHNLRALAKKYRHVRSDVQPVIEQLQDRLIYHRKTPTYIVLVTVYSKLDQGDISAEQIRRIVREFDEQVG